MTPITVNVRFNNKSFDFTRTTLESKVKAQAKKHAPVSSALHQIMLPGLNVPVSTTWAATHILDTQALTLTTANSGEEHLRGAYNPAQVLRAFSQMAAIGVKVSSNSASATYAPYSASAQETLKRKIAQYKIENGLTVKPTTQAKVQKRKPTTRKPKALKAELPITPDAQA